MSAKLIFMLALSAIFIFGLSSTAQEVAPDPSAGLPSEQSQIVRHPPHSVPAPRPQGAEHSQSPAINCPCMGMMGRPGGPMGGPLGPGQGQPGQPGQPSRPESQFGMGMAMGMRPPMDEGRGDEMREKMEIMRQKMEKMRQQMEESRHRDEGDGHDKPIAERLIHAAKDLKLSEKQATDLKSVISSTQKDLIRKEAELQIAQIELKEAGHKDNPDLNQVKAKLQTISSIEADLRFARFKADAEAMSLLTEEQRAKVKEHLFDPHRAHHDRHEKHEKREKHEEHDKMKEKEKKMEKKEDVERKEKPKEFEKQKDKKEG